MQGRVKFHRKTLERQWFKKPNMFQCFFYLIAKANHKDGMREGIEVKRGQAIIGLKQSEKDTGISIQSFRTCLKNLELTGEISLKSTNKFTIVTVLKYCDYNDVDTDTNKELTNNQQTTNKQLTTNKNDKKEKNEKEKYSKEENANAFIENPPVYGNQDIQKIIQIMKEGCDEAGLVYMPGYTERNFAKHISSKTLADKIAKYDMPLETFIKNIIKLSAQPYMKACNTPQLFYQNWGFVLNASKNNQNNGTKVIDLTEY